MHDSSNRGNSKCCKVVWRKARASPPARIGSCNKILDAHKYLHDHDHMAKTPIHVFEQCCWDLRGVLSRFGPDEMCCDGLTPRQCRILRAVSEEPDLRLSELAAREGLTPGGLTRRIQPLLAG